VVVAGSGAGKKCCGAGSKATRGNELPATLGRRTGIVAVFEDSRMRQRHPDGWRRSGRLSRRWGSEGGKLESRKRGGVPESRKARGVNEDAAGESQADAVLAHMRAQGVEGGLLRRCAASGAKGARERRVCAD